MTLAGVAMAAIALALAGCKAAPAKIASLPGCTQQWVVFTGRVVDAANVLPSDAETRLTNRLALLETKTAHQMVIATVPTLQSRSVEDYALCLANHWAIGRKGIDDGLLLLVAPTERKLRIEVGQGLEARIPDDEAKRVIDLMLPEIRSGDYASGLETGTAALVNKLS